MNKQIKTIYGKNHSISCIRRKMDKLAADLFQPFDIIAKASLNVLSTIIPKAIYDICLIHNERLEALNSRLASLCHPHNEDILQVYKHYLSSVAQTNQAIFIDDTAQAHLSLLHHDSLLPYPSFALLPIYTHTSINLCIGIFFGTKHIWTSQERYELVLFRKLFRANVYTYQTMQNTVSIRQGHEDAFIALRHDLHTPLTSIQGYLELASRKIAQDTRESQIRHYLDIALQETHILQTRLDELLNLSMIDLDCFELALSQLEAEKLISAVVAEYKLLYPYRTINATVPAAPQLAHWDVDRVRQTLAHLLKNALMYSPDTSPVELHVSYKQAGVSIAVQDYGDGIDASKHDLIFGRYWRGVDNSFRKTYYGLGIGLYISRAFAEYHGGRLRVESSAKAGEGSRFILDLPWQAVQRTGGTGYSS